MQLKRGKKSQFWGLKILHSTKRILSWRSFPVNHTKAATFKSQYHTKAVLVSACQRLLLWLSQSTQPLEHAVRMWSCSLAQCDALGLSWHRLVTVSVVWLRECYTPADTFTLLQRERVRQLPAFIFTQCLCSEKWEQEKILNYRGTTCAVNGDPGLLEMWIGFAVTAVSRRSLGVCNHLWLWIWRFSVLLWK